jgi:hypothetical protein
VIGYVDPSVVLQCVIAEPEIVALRTVLAQPVAADDLLVASALAWLEVTRALRHQHPTAAQSATDDALTGAAELPIGSDMVARTDRVGGPGLPTSDAIHLAWSSAHLLPVRPAPWSPTTEPPRSVGW